jgi:hypothetical protein
MGDDIASRRAPGLEAKRRQRRRLELGFSLLAVVFAGTAVIVWVTSSGRAGISKTTPIKVGPAPRLAIKRHSALAVEIGAVRRLSAYGGRWT